MNQIKSDRLDASENKAFYKELLSLAIPIGMQKSANSFNRCNRRTYARQTYAGFRCRHVTGKSDCVYYESFYWCGCRRWRSIGSTVFRKK